MGAIDELRGVELAAAAAIAQGWEVNAGGIWVAPGGGLTQYDDQAHSPDYYRPDLNIAQAWELVEECNFTVAPKTPIGEEFNNCKIRTGWVVYSCAGVPLAFAHFPSRKALCAAICRAFLKAKATT